MSATNITLYYADWCGHCNKFKPTWENLKKQLINMSNVTYNEYESTKDADVLRKDGINSYPTIKITKNGTTTEYTGRRTEDAILKAITGSSGSIGGSRKYYKNKYRKYKTKYLNLQNKLK